jgi:hypothetical protein
MQALHKREDVRETRRAYQPPSVRVLSEDEVLMAFQMTAAEISAASCWWMPCPASQCP